MSEATIRAALKTIIDDVADSGIVHDYERFADTWDDFLTLFKTTISGNNVIRGWTITCESIPVTPFYHSGNRETGNDWELRYRFRYYHGLDDANASEKAAIAIVIAVMKALNNASTIETGTGIITPEKVAQCDVFEPRTYGGVLCHYAEVRQSIFTQDSGV